MVPTHCVECVAISLTNLLIMSYLDAQSWRSLKYIQRHDNAASYIRWKLVPELQHHQTSADKWYEHKPEAVVENKQPETRYHN